MISSHARENWHGNCSISVPGLIAMSETHLRIAVADDELDTREFLAKVLAHLGYDVPVVAADGRELVEKCRQTAVDLIITDIRMPVMDGIAAAKELSRAAPRPAILISAYHEDEQVRQALQGHVFIWLVKPVSRDQLQPAITRAMQQFREWHEACFSGARCEDRSGEKILVDR